MVGSHVLCEFKVCKCGDFLIIAHWGHGGRVVTLSFPISEAGVGSPAQPEVGKLVVACRWSAVYRAPMNYVLVSSALPTDRRDMTSTLLKVT